MKEWDLTQLVEFSKTGRVKKEIHKTEWFNIVLVCLEKGQVIPSRPEPYGVCFYIIDGKGTFTVGDEQTHVGQGSMVFAPAGVARGIESKKRLTILGIQQPH